MKERLLIGNGIIEAAVSGYPTEASPEILPVF